MQLSSLLLAVSILAPDAPTADTPIASPGAVPEPGGRSGTSAAPLPLEAPVDRAAIALRVLGDDDPEVHAALARAGLHVRSMERATASGWTLVELASALPSEPALDSALRRLAGEAVVATAAPVLRGARGHWGAPDGRLLLRVKPEDLPRAVELLPVGAEVLRTDFAGLEGAFELRLPGLAGLELLEFARALEASGAYRWVEPGLVFTGAGSQLPSDPLAFQQWSWNNIGQFVGSGQGVAGFDMGFEDTWQITTGDPSVGLLVIDLGVDAAHPDLNWTVGIDTIVPSAVPGAPVNLCDNHGTWVAGVTSALVDNATGLAGIVPDCELVSGKPFEAQLLCDGSWLTNSGDTAIVLDFGAMNGVRVTNNSNYYGLISNTTIDKYAELEAAGTVHVAAAGNFTSFGVTFPAALPSVIAVGATDQYGNVAGFTSLGPEVEFAAPGFDVWTTDRVGDVSQQGDYVLVEGTSFAAPHLAGLAAAMLSIDPALDQAGVRRILRAASRDVLAYGVDGFVGRDLVSGYGQPDALVALEIASGQRAGLATDGGWVDTWSGASVDLDVFTHPAPSGSTLFVVAGSATGTGPGLSVFGETLPLTPDAYFELTAFSSLASPLTNGVGLLDPLGAATTTFSLPAGALAPLSLDLHHAVLTLDASAGLAAERQVSAPRQIAVAPVSKPSSGSLDLAIPDGPTLSTTIAVSGLGTSLQEIDLETLIAHPFIGELELVLQSPAGTRVTIWSPNGSSFSNLFAVWGGYFGTVQSMDAFLGEDPNGTWTLDVTDSGSANIGVLQSWGLYLTSN